jgi:hypothetical protein
MARTKTLPVRFDDDELRLLEQSAALAKYPYVTTYIRDKTLDRLPGQALGLSRSAAEIEDLLDRLSVIERTQDSTHVLIALLLFFVRKRATSGEVADLIATCQHSIDADRLVRKALPDLGPVLDQIAGRS